MRNIYADKIIYNLKINILILFLIFFCLSKAQINHTTKYMPGKKGLYPSLVQFKNESKPIFTINEIPTIDSSGKMVTIKEVKLFNSIKDMTGMDHYRYQQTNKNIPIEDAVIIVHVKDNRIDNLNGDLIEDLPKNLPEIPLITFDNALRTALMHINAEIYSWQDSALKILTKDSNILGSGYYPKKEIVYYSGEGKVNPSALRLAYKIHIFSIKPINDKYVFIDACNGEILGEKQLMCMTAANGMAETAYSGKQLITTDYHAGIFFLRDMSRGSGIFTFNMYNQGDYSKSIDFIDYDNYWDNVNHNLDQYATDAHWGAEVSYDFYMKNFGRSSFDGNGSSINNYVHMDLKKLGLKNNGNALWIPSINGCIYGDGDYNIKPLTALDIVGHEISHGFTYYTSNLSYSQGTESSALNEGFSDIFGKCIEFFSSKPNPSWISGKDALNNTQLWRDLSNPQLYGSPSCYKGKFWDLAGEPHTNSTVLSHWFFLLVNGGNVTTDFGNYCELKGIGINKAARIAYFTNAFYLIPTSNYQDVCNISIMAAEYLYGNASTELQETIKAWNAVGLGLDGIISSPQISVCPGEIISVAYNCNTPLNKGNVLTLFLSDSNGSFKNEKAIGWLSSTKTQSIMNGIISTNTAPGNHYRVRIKSSDPQLIYTPGSTQKLTILENPLPTITASQTILCPQEAATLKASQAVMWQWSTGDTTQSITVKTPGTYSLNVYYSNRCESPTAEIKIQNPKYAPRYLCNVSHNNNAQESADKDMLQFTDVHVVPNPLKYESIISTQLSGKEKSFKEYSIQLFEAHGKKVAQFPILNNANLLKGKIIKGNLSAGSYYFTISSIEQNIRRGKIIIQ